MCFLHAYPSLWFSSDDKTWATKRRLIPYKFTYGTGLPPAIPDLPAPLNLRIRDNILGAVSRRTIL